MSEWYLSRQQVRELDRRAIEEYGVPGIVLMENAGRSCAELLMKLNPSKGNTIILCGPGNNGGDGYVIARHLDNHGWPVACSGFLDVKYQSPDAAVMRKACRSIEQSEIIDPSNWTFVRNRFFNQLNTVAWVVDSLFGTGLSRGLEKPFDDLIAQMNIAPAQILAIDIPSGLDCDTGETLGPTVRATHTATFVARKLGFQNPRAHGWTGEVHIVDIGAPRKLIEEYRNHVD